MTIAVPKPIHKRRVPKRLNRGKFSRETRDRIFDRDEGLCRACGALGTQIHHVKPKGSGRGRGVYSNGLLVCNACHDQIHKNNDLLTSWQRTFEMIYGPRFFKDEYDL
jgi:5-methylcytosine-specific restriction endonuclease McrA